MNPQNRAISVTKSAETRISPPPHPVKFVLNCQSAGLRMSRGLDKCPEGWTLGGSSGDRRGGAKGQADAAAPALARLRERPDRRAG